MVATASEEMVRVGDVTPSRLVYVARGHASRVLGVAYSPDRKWLIPHYADGTVHVLDSGSGELVTSLPRHASSVNAAVFLADAKRIRTISADGALQEFECEVCVAPERLIEIARGKMARIRRTLTDEERILYLPTEGPAWYGGGL